jgi:hypothetical protein
MDPEDERIEPALINGQPSFKKDKVSALACKLEKSMIDAWFEIGLDEWGFIAQSHSSSLQARQVGEDCCGDGGGRKGGR